MTKIIRNTEKKAFQTSVYRKSTFSGVFTNFKSFIHMTNKTGLLENWDVIRCFSICSSYEKIHKEIAKFKEIFKRNSYPQKFIDRCIKNIFYEFHVPKVVELTAAKKELMLVFHTLDNNHLKFAIEFTLKVVFQSSKQLSTLFTFNDKINKMFHSNLLYKSK